MDTKFAIYFIMFAPTCPFHKYITSRVKEVKASKTIC
jgi:hypothetical protein